MNYRTIADWLEASGLVTGIDIGRGVYIEPTIPTARKICVIPTGGTAPSDVNNQVLASIFFISQQEDNPESFEDLINSVIEHSRCNYKFDGFNIKATTMLPSPVMTQGNRAVYEIGFVMQ